MPSLKTKLIPLSIISSGPNPQSGQNNRSSGDLTTQEFPEKANGFYWTISGPNADEIEFNVMEDHSGGSDPTLFTNVKNGFFSSPKIYRKIYIANPQHATSVFTVTVYATISDIG